MKRSMWILLSIWIVAAMLFAACAPAQAPAPAAPEQPQAEEPTGPVAEEGQAATVVEAGELVPPIVATPCAPGECLFEGQTVTVIVNTAGPKGPISGPFYEVRDEFEKATGATL